MEAILLVSISAFESDSFIIGSGATAAWLVEGLRGGGERETRREREIEAKKRDKVEERMNCGKEREGESSEKRMKRREGE